MTDDRNRDAEYFAGMTVNERLFDAALLDAFDDAVRARNRAKIISILKQVFVENADRTADAVLKNPSRYGY